MLGSLASNFESFKVSACKVNEVHVMMWFLDELLSALPPNLKSVPNRSKECIHMKTSIDIPALKAHALNLWETDNSQAMELGQALRDLREALRSQHGAFKKWWQENKLKQARVSYCMRLASGKLRTARMKQPTTAQIVTARIKKHVDITLKGCADSSKVQVVDEIEDKLKHLFIDLIQAVGQMRGWDWQNGTKTERAVKRFTDSLATLLDSAYPHLTFEDLDRIHPDRIQQPIKTEPISDCEARRIYTKLRQGLPTPVGVESKTA
jgi:hypothetical protein